MFPKLIDTHAHLYTSQFDNDIQTVIQRAKKVNEAIFLPNIDLDSIDAMLRLVQHDTHLLYPMMGLHPCSVKSEYETALAKMYVYLQKHQQQVQQGGNPIFYGIGETGIDLYWDTTFEEEQKKALLTQIQWAKDFDLPIILHCRNALDIVIDMIAAEADAKLKGIFHCFDGTEAQAKRITQIGGFKLGIGGVVTYKKSELPKVLETIDLQHIVLETDSPYLPPTPHRGLRNESSYLAIIAQKLVEIYGLTYDKIAYATHQNAMEVFTLYQQPTNV